MGSVKRRAPKKTGYTFPEKETYRYHVWSGLAAWCPVPPSRALALLMPSIEGTEIEVAKRFGFREENLCVVDSNPAIVATLKRRFPLINSHDVAGASGVPMDVACERLAKAGVNVHVANFDFTSCMGFSFVEMLGRINRSRVGASGFAWAITLQRGRETFHPQSVARSGVERVHERLPTMPRQLTALDPVSFIGRLSVPGSLPITNTDLVRLAAAWSVHFAPTTRTLDRLGVYPSGSLTMLWALFRPLLGRSAYGQTGRKAAKKFRRRANEHAVSFILATCATEFAQWRDVQADRAVPALRP